MRNPICISTGFLYRIVEDFNERISYDRQKAPVLLNYLDNINIPVVLEYVALNKNQVQLIRKEIKYIKKV